MKGGRIVALLLAMLLGLGLFFQIQTPDATPKEVPRGDNPAGRSSLEAENRNVAMQEEIEQLKGLVDHMTSEGMQSKQEAERLKLELQKVQAELSTVAGERVSKEKALEVAHQEIKQLSSNKKRTVAEKRQVVCKDPNARGRPIFLFVVGAEGTGHHLIADLVDKFPGVTRMSRRVQQLFAEMWEPKIGEDRREVKKQELLGLLREEADKAALALANPNPGDKVFTHFVVQTKDFDMYSFPYDDPRNPLRRPDVLDLIELVEPHFDLRILVTIRDQADSIVSLIRRKWWTTKMCDDVPAPTQRAIIYTEWPINPCGLIYFQARVVEDALVYISSHLQTISQEYYRTVRYEDFLNDPAQFVQPLASFFQFNPDEIRQIVVSHVKKKETDYTEMLTPAQRDTITRIFGTNRDLQWRYLMRPDFDIRNFTQAASLVGNPEEVCYGL